MNAKSEPDRIAELKTTVDVFERELQISMNKTNDFLNETRFRVNTNDFMDTVRVVFGDMKKTLNAYREYVNELEKYVPH